MKKSAPFVPDFDDVIHFKAPVPHEWVESTMPGASEGGGAQFLGMTIGAKRISLFFLCIFFVLGIFIVRSAYVQLFEGRGFALLAERNKVKSETVSARRGVVYDRNGIVLTQNIPRFVLELNTAELPRGKDDRAKLFKTLSDFSGMPLDELEKKVRHYAYADALILKDYIEYPEALSLMVKTGNLPGVSVELKQRREYLLDGAMSLSHLLGYMGTITEKEYLTSQGEYRLSDAIGREGLEMQYESILRGHDGKRNIEVDALGSEKRITAEDAPVDGKSLVLSIDKELQKKSESALRAVLDAAHIHKGVVIVSRPKTGEILSMVSLPAYDNNVFSQGISQKDYSALHADTDLPLYNRVIQGEYPAGSTIKMVVGAAALEEHVVTPQKTFLSTGGVRVYHWFFPDWKAGGHGVTNLAKALAESVNTYFYLVGGGSDTFKGLGPERLVSYFLRFGLGKSTGIDFPDEHTGFVPSPAWKLKKKGEPWYIGDTYHVAIGQGDLLVTPLQVHLTTIYFANNGWSMVPRLVHSFRDTITNTETPTKPVVYKKHIVSDATVESVRVGLRQAVLAGSAKRLTTLPVTAAGKTGTAQFQTGKNPHAWFTGWAPYDNPEIVVTVLVEEGVEGSRTALAVADDIMRWYFIKYPLTVPVQNTIKH